MHRRDMAVLTLIGAVIACAAAAVAPTFRGAAAVSALRARMVTASPDASGIEVAGTAWPHGAPDATLASKVPTVPLSTGKIRGISVGGRTTQLQVGATGPVEFATLVWRQDDCAHVVFRSGRCPTAPNEVALSVNSAQVLAAKLGSSIVASHLDQPDFGLPTNINNHVPHAARHGVKAGNFALHDKVVGLYDVPSSQTRYWFGQDISGAVLSSGGAQLATVTALVPRETLTSLPLPYRARITVDQAMDWSHATPAQAQSVASALSALQKSTPSYHSVTSQIPSLLSADAKDRGQLNRLIRLAQIQLLLLVGLVLIAILAAGMDRRRAELVIATLQGRRPIATAFSVAAEPVVLLAIGVVPGLAISLPLAMIGAHVWLQPGTPVHLTGSAVLAALAVTAVAAAVTVVIGFIAASRSLNDQLAEDARSAGGRAGSWIDIIAMTLAAAGLVELLVTHTGSSSTPWSLLAPSLCGLAAGLALGRIVPLLLTPLVRATAESRRIGRFLAIRELRRDRAAWRVTAIVALALSLLSFAVTVNRGAATDRGDRAGLIVGAPAVATVLVPPNKTLLSAVDAADPAGKWAMAAELIEPFGSASLRTLAIDTPRLAAVAGWQRQIDGYTPQGIAHILHVPDSIAAQRLPVMTAGNVQGSTYGLSNEQVPLMQIYPTNVLPVLLGEGSLTDLQATIANAPPAPISQLGTTVLTEQVWLGPAAPSDAVAKLHAQGLTVTTVTRRTNVEESLERFAETSGLSGFLAVAILAAALAIALLIGTSVAAVTRQRTETLALTSAGVSGSVVVVGRTAASLLRLTIAGVTALACGIGTAHLSARLVPEASFGAVPKPLLPLPPLPAVIAVVVTLIPALAIEAVVASYAAKRADAATLRTALP
jgi:hypothetical protein